MHAYNKLAGGVGGMTAGMAATIILLWILSAAGVTATDDVKIAIAFLLNLIAGAIGIYQAPPNDGPQHVNRS